MRVEVAKHKCIGSGACVVACSSVFAIGEDGFVVMLDATPPESLRDQVEDAADACPAAVISTA